MLPQPVDAKFLVGNSPDDLAQLGHPLDEVVSGGLYRSHFVTRTYQALGQTDLDVEPYGLGIFTYLAHESSTSVELSRLVHSIHRTLTKPGFKPSLESLPNRYNLPMQADVQPHLCV